ncbi:nucleotidyltransferase [Clostridium vincentii]|uniref:tRNA(Met) cytidine acetate ligase n=1 Tax=Clostridium vincentii TaxID=52704 RepID=A0A2T0BJY0_9CLOT|nr:nucleotidyltransferase [Clostridium vincentii]PRR84157.1 hypothetical protein CLVI_04550 [Clostridium vincentii]
MKITGIITEYNPFHLGHLYHLQKAKIDTKSEGIICIMSGNFVQRGTPALIDKWTRARMAVENGVDLVIELPLVYSISSAEGFSEGAVNILNSTGVVSNIFFGSEHGETSDLDIIASTLLYEPDAYRSILKSELKKGFPYHTARSVALKEYLPKIPCTEILSNSNNILAIEYIKAIKKSDSSIVPLTLKRVGADYNTSELSTIYPSATSIRAKLKDSNDLSQLKNSIPTNTYKIFTDLANNNYNFVYGDDIFPYLKYKLLTEGEKIKDILDVKEGLDNKILKEIIASHSLSELILKVKSKRYTYTRISRILTCFFIGLENYNAKEIMNERTNYIRPLAFNDTGIKILKEIKDKDQINILTKVPKKISDDKLKLDLLGTKAYSILNPNISPLEDYYKSPIYLK